ncbi:MAG: ribosome biogenesis GTPase Der [Opitutales bacterium]
MSDTIESRTVAVVGRPNVGKSRLFNCLTGRRISIVHDQPGVTRDVISAEVKAGYTLLDTGGIGMEPEATPEVLREATETQVQFALQAARVILFVVDFKDGVTPVDIELANAFRRQKTQPILIVNKADHAGDADAAYAEFGSLGFENILPISAEHKIGIGAINKAIIDMIGPLEEEKEAEERRISISLIGRPNVGKSSMTNAMLKSDRVIVSDIPGTTRDTIEMELDYTNKRGELWRFLLNDTAGLRSRTKVDTSVEYFSSLRSEETIKRSDVVFLVIDAEDGITKQEQRLAGMALDWGKALIIVVNKWDLVFERFQRDFVDGYDNESDFRKSYAEAIQKELFFLPGTPVVFTSAVTGFSIENLLKTAVELDAKLEEKIPTGRLNARIKEMLEHRSPKKIKTARFKIYYAVHVGRRPYKIKLFCNSAEKLHETYERYLEKGIQETFGLEGCPVEFELVGKAKRYTEGEVDNPEDMPTRKPKPKRRKKPKRPRKG